MLRDKIIAALSRATGLPEDQIHLEFPENADHGDYSSNVALQLKNSRQLAEEIVKKLTVDSGLKAVVSKVEVAGPGFINFWLKGNALVKNLGEILAKKKEYGRSDYLKGKRINFEFGQPNTHKLPHIGHLFSYIYGSSVTNLLEAVGAKLYRVNYQGDIGPHVAKCLWALEKERPLIPDELGDRVKLLQAMYQKGSRAYEEDEKARAEISGINKKIYDSNPSIRKLWLKTRSWSVNYYKKFEKRIGIKYDRYYFESEVQVKGKEIVETNVGKVFKESQGAVIFEGGKYGLHDRVFVTKLGTPTYEAKDMYLQVLKYAEWPFDSLFITTANEQNAYFGVVFKALELVNPKLAGKLNHIGFGMVNLKGGKMSSRTGEIIGAVDLIETAVRRVRELIKDDQNFTDSQKDEVAEKVGVGAVKYSFLKNNPLQNTIFDLQESISTEGNSGPYLQYTYARCKSVLAKAGSSNSELQITNSEFRIQNLELNSEELLLLRALSRFPEIIVTAAKSYSPNLLCEYLFDLAQKYNNFYNVHRILGLEDGREQSFRVALTAGVAQVLQNGLSSLGIQAPERM